MKHSYLRHWLAGFAVAVIAAVLFLGYQRFIVQPRQEEAIAICELYGGKEWIDRGFRSYTWWEELLEDLPRPARQPMRWFTFDWRVEDADIASIAYVPGLVGMEIDSRGISDATLLRVPSPSGFMGLRIRNTPVTDRGLNHFRRAPLQLLELQSTKVTTAGLFALNFSRLQTLEIDYDLLAGSTPIQRRKLAFLEILAVFDGPRETPRDWSFLRDCPLVSHLCLSRAIDAAVIAEMTTLTQLRWLELRGVRDEDFALLHSIKPLALLAVSGDIDGSGLAKLNGRSVVWLQITSKRLNESSLGLIKDIQNVRNLTLATPGLSPQSLVQLHECPQLRTLEIDGIGISDADIEIFQQLPKLGSLTLKNTRLTNDGVIRLRSLLPNHSISFYASDARPPQEDEIQK